MRERLTESAASHPVEDLVYILPLLEELLHTQSLCALAAMLHACIYMSAKQAHVSTFVCMSTASLAWHCTSQMNLVCKIYIFGSSVAVPIAAACMLGAGWCCSPDLPYLTCWLTNLIRGDMGTTISFVTEQQTTLSTSSTVGTELHQSFTGLPVIPKVSLLCL